jgi:hypothetical protein
MLSWTASATAQSGIQVDPDSPSGTEYQLPLDRARRDAQPPAAPSSRSGSADASAPAFGAGIRSSAPDTAGGGGGPAAAKDSPRAPTGSTASGAEAGRVAAVRIANESSDTSLLLVCLIAAGVLVAGGGIGFAVRRWRG